MKKVEKVVTIGGKSDSDHPKVDFCDQKCPEKQKRLHFLITKSSNIVIKNGFELNTIGGFKTKHFAIFIYNSENQVNDRYHLGF